MLKEACDKILEKENPKSSMPQIRSGNMGGNWVENSHGPGKEMAKQRGINSGKAGY